MTERTDYDSPWKNILEHYLPDFMAFFFPVPHEEQQMTYITTAERFGRAQGLAEGRAEGRALALDGIVLVLEMKFGESAAPVIDAIRQVTDLAILEAVIAQIKTAQSLEDVQRVLAPPTQ